MVSSQPRKTRKKMLNAPLHKRQKMLGAPLSEELRKKIKKRSLPVRKGDTVVIMRGKFRGKEGTVERVDLKKTRIFIAGIKRQKNDGKEVLVPIHPSKVMIKDVFSEDDRRF